jgi:hypothetical protein
MTTLPPDLKARVLQATRQVPSPTRGQARARAWLVLPAAVMVAAALFFAFGGFEHGRGRPVWFYAASCVGWAAVATVSVWSALGRGGSALGRSRAWLLATAVGTPATLFAMMFACSAAYPEVTAVHAERLGFHCLGLTVAAAAFPLLALLGLRRSSDPVHPAATGAALGTACGASAGVMVEMWCPTGTPQHIALGHLMPIALLALLGAAFGTRVLRVRRR